MPEYQTIITRTPHDGSAMITQVERYEALDEIEAAIIGTKIALAIQGPPASIEVKVSTDRDNRLSVDRWLNAWWSRKKNDLALSRELI